MTTMTTPIARINDNCPTYRDPWATVREKPSTIQAEPKAQPKVLSQLAYRVALLQSRAKRETPLTQLFKEGAVVASSQSEPAEEQPPVPAKKSYDSLTVSGWRKKGTNRKRKTR